MEKKLGIKKLIPVYIFTVLMIGIDQLTKYFAAAYIPKGLRNTVIKGFFYFTYCENTGAAWSILTGKTFILGIVSFLAAAVICFLLSQATSAGLAFSMGAILSGALGNMIDRFARGYVIDFLDFDIFTYNFPIFNFADICVVCGCIGLAFVVIFSGNKKLILKPAFLSKGKKDNNEND